MYQKGNAMLEKALCTIHELCMTRNKRNARNGCTEIMGVGGNSEKRLLFHIEKRRSGRPVMTFRRRPRTSAFRHIFNSCLYVLSIEFYLILN